MGCCPLRCRPPPSLPHTCSGTGRLLVEEDDGQLTLDFQLDPATGSGGGIMKRFHGRWHVRPHPADPEHASLSTLDQVGGGRGGVEVGVGGSGHRSVRGCGERQAGTVAQSPRLHGSTAPLVCRCRRPPLRPTGTCTGDNTVTGAVTGRTWLWASTCPLPLTESSSASPAARSKPSSRMSRGGAGEWVGGWLNGDCAPASTPLARQPTCLPAYSPAYSPSQQPGLPCPCPPCFRETDNVNRGQPTLCPWQEVRDKQIGVEEAAAEGQGEGQEKGDDSQAAAEAAEGAAAAALPEAAGGGTLPAEAAVSANP